MVVKIQNMVSVFTLVFKNKIGKNDLLFIRKLYDNLVYIDDSPKQSSPLAFPPVLWFQRHVSCARRELFRLTGRNNKLYKRDKKPCLVAYTTMV